jgi:hypothetical protein
MRSVRGPPGAEVGVGVGVEIVAGAGVFVEAVADSGVESSEGILEHPASRNREIEKVRNLRIILIVLAH